MNLFLGPAGVSYDLALVARTLHTFVNRIDYLFVSGERGCMKCGYTCQALEELLRQPRVAIVKNAPVSFGGPDSVNTAMLDRCASIIVMQ